MQRFPLVENPHFYRCWATAGTSVQKALEAPSCLIHLCDSVEIQANWDISSSLFPVMTFWFVENSFSPLRGFPNRAAPGNPPPSTESPPSFSSCKVGQLLSHVRCPLASSWGLGSVVDQASRFGPSVSVAQV